MSTVDAESLRGYFFPDVYWAHVGIPCHLKVMVYICTLIPVSIELKNEAHNMLNWVRQCPTPSELRVYLSPALARHSPSLPRYLLALGCTVTMRRSLPPK